jgi:hypothetical protein
MTDDTDSVDRPALKPSEIEVTPEMIEAGVDVLKDYFYDIMLDRGICVELVCGELLSEALKSRKVPASLRIDPEPLKSKAKDRIGVFVRL